MFSGGLFHPKSVFLRDFHPFENLCKFKIDQIGIPYIAGTLQNLVAYVLIHAKGKQTEGVTTATNSNHSDRAKQLLTINIRPTAPVSTSGFASPGNSIPWFVYAGGFFNAFQCTETAYSDLSCDRQLANRKQTPASQVHDADDKSPVASHIPRQ